jgi:DNA repair protein SbcD/Mre11
MRFLHLADLHLDTTFANRKDSLRTRLRAATREAVERAVQQALSHEVDAVLIAGDLFDGDHLSFHTERFLTRAVQRLTSSGITVVYATGNHDPGGPSGPASRIPWPQSVALLSDAEPRRIPILREGELVGRVTGAGHTSAREARDLSATFPRPQRQPGVAEVALLHTQVLDTPGGSAHDRYAPSHLPALRGAGFDYWALGHIHLRQGLSVDPPIHYPGNLQGRHPGESGAKGALLVELPPGQAPTVEFLELAPVRWESLRLGGLDEATSMTALAGQIQREWREARDRDPGLPGAEWILRVELAGPSPLYRTLQSEEERRELARDVESALGLLQAEVRAHELRPPLDPSRHRGRVDILGEALRLLDELSDPEGPSPSRTLSLEADQLAGLAGAEADEYLRDLLRGEAPLLLDRLLEGEGR